MGSGLNGSKGALIVIDDTATFTEPSSGSSGVDLTPLRDGGYLPDRAAVLIRKGASAAAGALTLTGPVYLDLYIDGNWYKSGKLNGGSDITLEDTGWAERVEDVGLATRVAVHADTNPSSNIDVDLVFVDDDDE